MRQTRRTIIRALALSMLTAACTRSPRVAGDDDLMATGPAVLIVQNHNYLDMNIFVIPENGTPMRLGMTTGQGTSTFRVEHSHFRTGLVRFLADPIGGSGTARTSLLSVTGGSTVTFIIQPDLAQSMASVH